MRTRVIISRPSHGDMQRSVALDVADAGIVEQMCQQFADNG